MKKYVVEVPVLATGALVIVPVTVKHLENSVPQALALLKLTGEDRLYDWDLATAREL